MTPSQKRVADLRKKLNLITPNSPEYLEVSAALRDAERREKQNKARRERHEALTSLGLKRVRGALGGVYYE